MRRITASPSAPCAKRSISSLRDAVLERQQGRGTFVRRARFNSSLFRFFRFQSESGERRVPKSRIIRRKSVPANSAVASALRIPVGEPVISLSRLRLIDDVPLLAEEIWLQQSRFAPILEIDTAEFGDLLYPLYEERCGEVVVSAEEILTVETANEMQARLLRLEAHAPLIVIERLALDLERQPIEWRRSRGQPTGSATTPRSAESGGFQHQTSNNKEFRGNNVELVQRMLAA